MSLYPKVNLSGRNTKNAKTCLSSVRRRKTGGKDGVAFNESKYRRTPSARKNPLETRWENCRAAAGTRRGFALSEEVNVRVLW